MSSLTNAEHTLRTAQVSGLEKMLRFNKDAEAENSGAPVAWKVLIFDSVGRDIVSSVLRMSDLFKNGVTLHLMLNAKRNAIPDVPAVYFVEPTPENIEIIGKDVANGLYSSWNLNFTRPLTRDLLEDLAAKTLHSSARINQVYEQYLQFNVLEPDVFSLELPNTYRILSDPRTSETEIESRVSKIVDGLFCMLMTLGVVPVIRASRGNAAEMVAQMLDERLRSLLLNRRSELPASVTDKRAVLSLVDRNLDLVSMFSHSWTYQSLINDTCEFKRNAIKVPDGQIYDIEPTDTFWQQNQKLPFPEVADNLDAYVTKYKEDARKVTGHSDMDPASIDLAQTTTSLKTALTAVPELTQRKKSIDMHMSIATILLKAIGDRGLAQLFEAEETAGRQTAKSILEIVKNPELGTLEDKLRLHLVYYITIHGPGKSAPKEDLAAIEEALKSLSTQASSTADVSSSNAAATDELRALKYVKRTKEISRMTVTASGGQQGSAPVSASPDLFRRFTGSLTEKLNQGGSLTEGFGNLISGVRNFLPENKDLPVTKIAQQLLDPLTYSNSSASGVTDDFLYFNPHESRGSHTRPPPKRTVYDQAIVFMVGGGNYFEYANVAAKLGSKVLYGATDIPTPHQFVEECAELGAQL